MCPSDSRPALPLVWMNGFPGIGKLTIAKLLATLLKETNPLLIDNHSLIDPVEVHYPRDHPDYQQERRRGREAVFTNLVDDPTLEKRTVIFTDVQSDNDLGRDVAEEYKAAATRARRPFLPIYLECDIEENARRIVSLQRTTSGTKKLLDPEILAEIRSRCQLFRFEDVEGIAVDITNIGPEEVAEFLAREVMRIMATGQKNT